MNSVLLFSSLYAVQYCEMNLYMFKLEVKYIVCYIMLLFYVGIVCYVVCYVRLVLPAPLLSLLGHMWTSCGISQPGEVSHQTLSKR